MKGAILKYSIESDGEIVETGLTLYQAESALCRFLNWGCDAYIIDELE